jgi:DNA-binding HxlR family transcriptional regulator
VSRANGNEYGVRAGTLALLMVASTAKRHILRELLDGPKSISEMHEEDGSPAVVGELEDAAVKITPTGREMLFVSFVLERWLQSSPLGALPLGSDAADDATAALACGWSTTLTHTLAREPLTFPQMSEAVALSYRSLEDHVDAMEQTGLLVRRPGGSGGARYAVTDWLRAGIAPLSAAARLERVSTIEDALPIDALDVEAAFMLTLPMLELPTDLSGTCLLGVEVEGGPKPGLAGATARIDGGRVVSCVRQLDENADAWATASAPDWLDTVIEPDAKRVSTGGNRLLASILLDRLHRVLFGIPVA